MTKRTSRRRIRLPRDYVWEVDLAWDQLFDLADDEAALVAHVRRGNLLGYHLRKHEREAVQAIREVADHHGVSVAVIRRGRHPIKAVLSGEQGVRTIGLPGSPRDPVWAVRVARKQAEQACRVIADEKKLAR